MTHHIRRLVPFGVLSLVALAAGACNHFDNDEPAQTETRTVELDRSESVSVELKMGAGELNVGGGASGLMDGTFTFTSPSLKPEVVYTSGSTGRLLIEQPSGIQLGKSHYRWDVRLNNRKPIDLLLNFGAGQGHLEIGSLDLRSVDVQMGVGELKLDLRGTPEHDYRVNVRGGIGQATIYLPQGVGIAAEAKGGIGSIKARGLDKRDGLYVNDAYGHAKTTVRLDIHGGIGEINLVTELERTRD